MTLESVLIYDPCCVARMVSFRRCHSPTSHLGVGPLFLVRSYTAAKHILECRQICFEVQKCPSDLCTPLADLFTLLAVLLDELHHLPRRTLRIRRLLKHNSYAFFGDELTVVTYVGAYKHWCASS